MDADVVEATQNAGDDVPKIDLGDYWGAHMGHVGAVIGPRGYEVDDPTTPKAWRIVFDSERTDMHMPAHWSPEQVKEAFGWYLRGHQDGEDNGIKLGKRQVSNAVSMLRDLGIGTVLLPVTAEE